MKPLVTMPDVLLACGELNKRERVAVQWVIDRYERERSAGLTVDEAHRAACDAYNNYSADNAPLTWGEYCRQCLTSALEAKSGNDES